MFQRPLALPAMSVIELHELVIQAHYECTNALWRCPPKSTSYAVHSRLVVSVRPSHMSAT